MSDTENDNTVDGGFVSDYDNNKDSSASAPLSVVDGGLIAPESADVKEDDSAEPNNADVQHLATPEDVEASE